MIKNIILKIYYLNITQQIFKIIYLVGSRNPWSVGYLEYRNSLIKSVLESKNDFDLSCLPKGYGFGLDERVVEYPWLIQNIPTEAKNVLDAGSVLNYNFILRTKKLKNKNILISNLNPEISNFNRDSISYLYGIFGDLRNSIVKDNMFDVIICGSVIEHIGMDNTKIYSMGKQFKNNDVADYIKATNEFYRTLKKGGVCLITVPFGKYSHREWLQVFDKSMVDNICNIFGLKNSYVDYFNYSNGGWRKSNLADCSKSVYFDVHKDKKFRKDKLSAAESVACIKLIKS